MTNLPEQSLDASIDWLYDFVLHADSFTAAAAGRMGRDGGREGRREGGRSHTRHTAFVWLRCYVDVCDLGYQFLADSVRQVVADGVPPPYGRLAGCHPCTSAAVTPSAEPLQSTLSIN